MFAKNSRTYNKLHRLPHWDNWLKELLRAMIDTCVHNSLLSSVNLISVKFLCHSSFFPLFAGFYCWCGHAVSVLCFPVICTCEGSFLCHKITCGNGGCYGHDRRVYDSQPFRSRANSLPGANRPIEPWPIRSLAHSLPGTFAPGPFRSLAFSLLD